jgi:phosphoglycerate dehydrogenase-like enzyme
MATLRVAVLNDFSGKVKDFADWASLDAEIVFFRDDFADEEDLVANLAGFDVLVVMRERTRFPGSVLRRLDHLKLLVTTGMANTSIDFDVAKEMGVTICGTNYPDLAGASVMTWALILAAARNIPQEVATIRGGGWGAGIGAALEGKTLGLLGLGRLGSKVARVGQAFDMRVIAWSHNLTAEKAAAQGVECVTREELFAQSDFLSIHLILSDRTHKLVGARELEQMKPTAWLVNTSRGPIIDQDALVRALSDNHLGGAALDVMEPEPLPRGHPLRTLDNVILTPHVGYVTDYNYRVFYTEIVENIAAFAAGKPIRVLLEAGMPLAGAPVRAGA